MGAASTTIASILVGVLRSDLGIEADRDRPFRARVPPRADRTDRLEAAWPGTLPLAMCSKRPARMVENLPPICVVAVRLVDLCLQHRPHVPRLNADHRQARFGKNAVKIFVGAG